MKKIPKQLPDKPGVYFFKKGKEIIYIGKATNLRDRVRSYFCKDLIETRGPKLVKMLEVATSLDFQVTDSVLEALILEAALIKKHQPKANSAEKDDKSFNYVVITKEDFPRILVVRGKNLPELTEQIRETFGPFPHGLELREALKIIRRIFPYRDKCLPAQAAGEPMSGTRCFNAQIGLCPGVCSGEVSKSDYAKVIRSIILMFKGKKGEVLKGLRKHMKAEAKAHNFEKAAELRNKIFALEHINDVALMKRQRLEGAPKGLRLEAYDVAHISGSNAVGVMVVMEDGILVKDEYRKFKLRVSKNDDVASLTELLSRRMRHREWRYPDLVVIDGGLAQKTRAEQILGEIAVASVVKNAAHKPDHIMGEPNVVKDHHHDILAINAEAHRFAIAYHRLLRGKGLQ